MEASTTQTIWSWLSCGDYPPAKTAGVSPDAPCWLCGGPVGDHPWRQRDAISPTFTDYAEAKCLTAEAVCQPCVALSRSQGWAQYVHAYPERGFAVTFPPQEGKKPRDLNWLYMSHLFTPDHHQTPDRARWREILICPPPPPFVAVLAVSGKKQSIFKARVNHSQRRFSVQADDRVIWVEPEAFRSCLADFEALYGLGLSKRAIASGDYPQAALLKIGTTRWRALEQQFAPWRRSHPQWVMLAEHCAQRAEEDIES